MLSALSCRNFRSLEDVDIPLEPLTALVGPNGAGKSAVLRAIDLVSGPVWPSVQRLRFPHDFFGFDDSLSMEITVTLRSPIPTQKDKLGTQHPIHGLRMRCRPYKRRTKDAVAGDPNFDYDPLDAIGDVPLECTVASGGRPTQQRPHRVTGDLRSGAACVLIDHRRAIAQHLPGTRGSVLGRLLGPALRDLDKPAAATDTRTRRELFREQYEQATEILRTPYVNEIETIIDETARQTLGLMGGQVARNSRVSFDVADPVNPYSSLRIIYSEDGLAFPAEESGLGVQSAIVVGIFEALRQKRMGAGTVLIDEPEMFLHPQAQRHFHTILVGLVEDGRTQVIYSTHSPIFADAVRFESLRLVRRPPSKSTMVALADAESRAALDTAKAATKLLTEYDTTRSEALFANAVLLVEGKADAIAVRAVAKRLKIDLDARNLTVMECGGKSSIPFHARLCRSLSIPVCVLFDEDVWPTPEDADDVARANIAGENRRAQKETSLIEEAVPNPTDRFIARPTLEEEMGIGRTASNKPMRMAERVESADTRDDLPSQLVEAVKRLDELDPTRLSDAAGAETPPGISVNPGGKI
jgi:putative ATP-dependent endonuclease of OLD family